MLRLLKHLGRTTTIGGMVEMLRQAQHDRLSPCLFIYVQVGSGLPRCWPGLLLLLLALAACGPASPPALRISLVGDVLLARAVPAALARDSAALRQTARQLWAGSHYVLANLECPLTDTARLASKPIVFQGNPR